MGKLPREIIAEVLSWMRVKFLLRFRCVSKPWCSIIDSKDFVKLHLNHAGKTSSNCSLILDGLDDHFCLSLDSLNRIDIGSFPIENHIILNSCNGLVLLVSDKPLLWNPSTRKVKKLPFTPVECPKGTEAYIREAFGFGYDSKNDDYKVVRVVEVRDANGRYLFSETKVYSLKSNLWTRVEDFPYILPNNKRVWGVHVNGALHTVVQKCPHYGSSQSIIAFDVGTSELYEVPEMDLTGENIGISSVEAMGGCLTALLPKKMNTSEIWVMKEYGVKESWTKLLSFVPPVPELYMGLCPLAYSESGDKVLLDYDGRCLIWYDLRRQKASKIKSIRGYRQSLYALDSLGPPFHAELCVGSLVSLDSSSETDLTEKQKGQEKNKEKKIAKKRDDFLSAGFKLTL
ncbi:F-box CPR30-like [Olea europaea subsp. europaea]|uniref:F-box CPR30-like n=1 Tax=Olea europaea subsp. europaea TaxID=158383 RepID=A0A8S0RCJ4_OLEEU|nr:F-box CPR30-like [Olea europaea subsp. europaea]